MEIPKSLAEAKTTIELAAVRLGALGQAIATQGDMAAAAQARMGEIEPEIGRLRAALAEDDALAGVPAAADMRMSAEDRLAAEARLGVLHDELEHKREKVETAAAPVRTLGEKAHAVRAELVSAGEVFEKEKMRLMRALAAEFARDVGKMTLPALFRKWCAIDAGLGHWGGAFGMISVSAMGEQVVSSGIYTDPDRGQVAWKDAWRQDPAMLELQRQLAEVAILDARLAAKIEAAKRQLLQRAEMERVAERRRRDAEYQPATVNTVTHHPALTESERRNSSPPRPYQPRSWTSPPGPAPDVLIVPV